MPERIRLTGLEPGAFQHPTDVAALEAVKSVPFINFAIRKMMEYGFERVVRMECMADMVKVGPRSAPQVNALIDEAARILDMPRPDLFLEQQPLVNAYATGVQHPIIVIHSGLVDLMSEEELLAVLAHELGHIKCGHVLYLMTARFLTFLADLLGLAAFAIHGLRFALLEWMRKAELSCDRAALLGVQDEKVVLNVLMKLAGGSRAVFSGLTAEAFLEQAKEYEALVQGKELNRLYDFLARVSRTHPFPVVRAAEVHGWADCPEYRNILAGRARGAERKGGVVCPHCDAHLPEAAEICRFCGCAVKASPTNPEQDLWGVLSGFGKKVSSGVSDIADTIRSKVSSEPAAPNAPDASAGGSAPSGSAGPAATPSSAPPPPPPPPAPPAAVVPPPPPAPAADAGASGATGVACHRCGAADEKGRFCGNCGAPLR
ncbi:MAG: M48 family metalloprotease [Planctomycetes bacterium]|nr:M48 family metalloprotease [Planctomycetota bacterium]